MAYSSWCRLCGSTLGSFEISGDMEQIIDDVLRLKLPHLLICLDCVRFLNNLSIFKTKAQMLQSMFKELRDYSDLHSTELSENELNTFRSRFGLKKINGSGEKDIHIEKEEEIHEFVMPSEEDHHKESGIDQIIEIKSIKEITNRKTKEKNEQTDTEKLYEFKCHVCNEEFTKMPLLTRHCHAVHQTTPQVLCFCGTFLSSWKRLMAHKSKHIKDDNGFKCNKCSISYKTLSAYEKHLNTKHGPNAVKFICEICGKEFKERHILKSHEKVHLPDELKLKHPCTYCPKKFVNNHCLKIHIARIHEKVALHTCELCGKGCITKSDLKWHMDKHIEERNYECNICHLKFKSTNSLRIHKRRHFNQDTIIVCSVCGKNFHSPGALSAHKLVHSDVKRYKCFCGNEYKRLESYKCHLSTHTGERPFSCLWCTRTFVNSANCRKHKLKDHPQEVAQHEAIYGKKGVSLAVKTQSS
ncbi:CLUMA_CG020469, isoform A [Clunio marinus]|uniref:CLUMA_CG020469, isoform A n=1 Tax=Clunio marinus TaxID=568069 RepID=A0A1J1J535_9DIPT|nr:CLUMA_CG020469, isoform A [Clunio marinus]